MSSRRRVQQQVRNRRSVRSTTNQQSCCSKPLKWKCATTCQRDEAPTEPSPAYRTTAGRITECRYSNIHLHVRLQIKATEKQQLQRSEFKPEASSCGSGLIRGSKDGWMLFQSPRTSSGGGSDGWTGPELIKDISKWPSALRETRQNLGVLLKLVIL